MYIGYWHHNIICLSIRAKMCTNEFLPGNSCSLLQTLLQLDVYDLATEGTGKKLQKRHIWL